MVVVSDVHLSRNDSANLSAELARMVRAHQRHEIILNGDVFTLSLDPPDRRGVEVATTIVRDCPDLRTALRQHIVTGGRLTFVAGNHDGALVDPRARGGLLSVLELSDKSPLQLAPWFVRRAGIHVEHGHVYDPDNAPSHPLVPCSPDSEPLGVALTRRFIAPSRALLFAHAHETTPLAGLIRTLIAFGPRAPSIIARYFATAILLCLESGVHGEVELEMRTGRALLDGFATKVGVPRSVLEQLLAVRRPPTRHSAAETFMRLYFDRVIATVAGSLGAVALAGQSLLGGALVATSAAYLVYSVSRGKNRYAGRVEDELSRAAHAIRDLSGADLVVFGHTHRQQSADGYLNTGSFGYPRGTGRPYVLVDTDGRGEQRTLTARDA